MFYELLKVLEVYSGQFILNILLQEKAGNLAAGAIATLMDIVSHALIHRLGKPLTASINMSISYSSNAKLHVSKPSTYK